MQKNTIKFLSLFAGIGGFDLGLERAGMKCVGQVEIDQFCQRVLAKHWPDVKRIGDIRNVSGTEFGTVELICGGFPCQPFSTAGKRRGAKDDRYLWPEMVRVIEAIRPTWVIGENVAGIVSMALDQVHSDLESIGYAVQSFIIPACAVDAPHRRDRVWIVAYSKGEGVPGIKRNICKEECGSGKPLFQWISVAGENVSYSYSSGFGERRRPEPIQPEHGTIKCVGKDVADSDIRGNKIRNALQKSSDVINESCHVSNTINNGSYRAEWNASESSKNEPNNWVFERICTWLPEPGLGRVAHGVPGRVDRLRCLGNAVVPQIVEEIGKAIMQIECGGGSCVGEQHATAALQNGKSNG